MEKQPLLKIINVNKWFRKNLVLKDINFMIMQGEILGFLGLSGSGKTTLLNIICGFLKPCEGEVLYNSATDKEGVSEDFSSIYLNGGKIKSLIGFSAQDPSFYPKLTVWENLIYFGIMHQVKKGTLKNKIENILTILDMNHAINFLASDLSEGMKKRLDIACALVHEPKILILDEPTSNLDFKLRDELLEYIKKINEKGITIIFVSHFLEEITEICTDVLMINTSCQKIKSTPLIKSKFKMFITDECDKGLSIEGCESE